MKVTRATLFTCPDSPGCQIDYEWDETLAPENRVHTIVSIQKCAFHSTNTTSHTGKTFESDSATIPMIERNQRINKTLGDLEIFLSKKADELGVTWYYDDSGVDPVLHINVEALSLTTLQKTVAQTRLDTKFGSGKVIID